ncbi:imelysin family protein [Thalassomonas actiniarum]|uniref:Iron-regulated protein A n=1 Tax=Thalassomonas actiniarum TaxID=485447 RepID=A0AAF0C3N1_9GAMM|nr:imelysin family protein [Thalassomonas actiniarum]WDD99727.1 iron-regulated protein A precursor [Thalassomonas actiniarum]
MLTRKTLIAASVSALLLTACGGGSSSKDNNEVVTPVEETGFTYDAGDMITNLTKEVIVAGYDDLNTKAEAFHQSTLTLLNTPTAENLAAAQTAWQVVRVPWEQGEAHIFGPVDALSIDPHLDTWPLNTNDLQTLLDETTGFTAELVKGFNDDVQGFHTMEFLLFGDGVNDNTKSIDEMTALEREYLVATAEVFQGYTQALYDAWTVTQDATDANSAAYQDLLLTPDNEVYASELGVVEELINGLIGIVDEVGNGKIAEPFGASIDATDTSLVESQYSWNSLADFSNNIRGVQNVYRGEFEINTDETGLIDFVTAADATLASRVDEEIAAAITVIDAIAGDNDMPFRQAINDADARVRIQAAIDALSTLQATLENDVLTLLNDWKLN